MEGLGTGEIVSMERKIDVEDCNHYSASHVHTSLLDFGGFQGPLSITYYVENTTGNARDEVALYCNMSSAIPTPVIVWVDDRNATIPNDGTNYIYVDNGAYLVIINIDPTTTALRTYHCRVTNAYSNMVLDSPTRYNFNVTS